MVKRIHRRIVYLGIPVAMWFAGAACVTQQEQQAQMVHKVSYRCSRVGCDKSAEGIAGGAAPQCSCGSSMVLDSSQEPGAGLKFQK
jgi:hypothetical protein